MGFTADEIDGYEGSIFGFGISREEFVAQLRRLADEIEKPLPDHGGEYICLQKATTINTVEEDNYAMTEITLKFATKKRPEALHERS